MVALSHREVITSTHSLVENFKLQGTSIFKPFDVMLVNWESEILRLKIVHGIAVLLDLRGLDELGLLLAPERRLHRNK
jgi:N-formylglutamate amidohydrolase